MIEKQNDLKEVIVHLRTPSGAPPTGPRDLSGKGCCILWTKRECPYDYLVVVFQIVINYLYTVIYLVKST